MRQQQSFNWLEFFWQIESRYHQRLAWEDAKEARIARRRAEIAAADKLRAMLAAHPSGQLGYSKLNDHDALKRAGLL